VEFSRNSFRLSSSASSTAVVDEVADRIDCDRFARLDEPDRGRSQPNDRRTIGPGSPQLAHAGVAAALTQLFPIGLDDERMVKEV
jgi:hypothetical protein